jgi:DNA-binding MarR family transcriptional regulator
MRKFMLTAALIGLLALPLFAQRPGRDRGMMQIDAATLLQNKSVQEELKLTDKQKDALSEVSKKVREAMTEAFKGGGDKEAFKTAREEAKKAVTKIQDDLKPEQKKRLTQIETQVKVQMQGPTAFTKDDLASALKLTDKQKEEIKSIAEDTSKDVAEIRKDAGKDKEKRTEATAKIGKLNKEAVSKVVKSFDADQKKTFQEMTGEPFEYKPEFGGFGGGTGRPGKGGTKGKRTEKKDI